MYLLATNETIAKNQWYFVAYKWEYSSSVLKVTLYLNDKKYTATTSDFKDFSNGTTALGTSITGGQPLNGHLKQFSYSSVALSDADITGIYQNGRMYTIHTIYDKIGRGTEQTIQTGKAVYPIRLSYKDGVNGSTTAQISSISNNGNTISYTYDVKGNIKTITQNGKVITYHHNDLNELVREDNQV